MDLNLPQDQDYQIFIAKIKDFTGIDLSQYKEQQMKRRLNTLRTKYEFPTFAAFFEAIKKDQNLLNVFLDRMTINVSEFWRNPSRWTTLQTRFIPEMLRQRNTLKCWSAACSTGEEPYTLAMILAEQNALDVTQIIATDIDDDALRKAKEATYPERSVREVPDPYKKKYMPVVGNMYTVSDQLKRAISFKKHNLLKDRFDSSFDLIICRNVLIYFTNEAKHELYARFAEALRPGGILFVGSTEQIFSPSQYGLETADTFFYRKL